jgi:hypothetical protein
MSIFCKCPTDAAGSDIQIEIPLIKVA